MGVIPPPPPVGYLKAEAGQGYQGKRREHSKMLGKQRGVQRCTPPWGRAWRIKIHHLTPLTLLRLPSCFLVGVSVLESILRTKAKDRGSVIQLEALENWGAMVSPSLRVPGPASQIPSPANYPTHILLWPR